METERMSEINELLEHGIEVGAVVRRGARFYFRGEYLGNGYWEAKAKLRDDPHMEARLRTDIKNIHNACLERLYSLPDDRADR